MKSTAKKRVDLGPSPASLIDQERKFESVLGKLEARLGKNHPEVRKPRTHAWHGFGCLGLKIYRLPNLGTTPVSCTFRFVSHVRAHW